MLGYSSQIRLVSCLWLQGSIYITTVYFSIAQNELHRQYTSLELSCNVETISIGLRLFVARIVTWWTNYLSFVNFSDHLYNNLVGSKTKFNKQWGRINNSKDKEAFLT